MYILNLIFRKISLVTECTKYSTDILKQVSVFYLVDPYVFTAVVRFIHIGSTKFCLLNIALLLMSK